MSIFAPRKWEAPDENFVGHRNCMVRNMSRYNFIAPHAHGRCLDIGCGRGYGFAYFKSKCRSCTGVDVSDAFLTQARSQYPEISFVKHGAEKLPFAGNSFDTITSFEVIEHVEDDKAFAAEIVRVAAPGALVAISTPNRLVASGGRAKPLNKFHRREYTAEEFGDFLANYFVELTLYGQYEGGTNNVAVRTSFIDRIPLRIKHLLPSYVQDVLSVMLRPPLKMEDCHFDRNAFAGAHTIYAIGRAPR